MLHVIQLDSGCRRTAKVLNYLYIIRVSRYVLFNVFLFLLHSRNDIYLVVTDNEMEVLSM